MELFRMGLSIGINKVFKMATTGPAERPVIFTEDVVMSKIEEFKTYGVIKVFNASEGPQGKNWEKYNCECLKCGGKMVYAGSQILKYKDLGCPNCRNKIKKEKLIEKANSFSGQIYDNLEIIGFDGFGRRGSIIVKCRCLRCGQETAIYLTKVLHGEARQCAECARKNLKTGMDLLKESAIDGTNVLSIKKGRAVNKNSTTKATGISYMAQCGKYRAYIFFRRKQYYLGLYSDLEDAIRARKEAEEKMFGEFIKWYAEAYPEQWEKIKNK